MKTTYSNVKNPKRLTWILGSVVIVGYVAFIAMIGIDHTGWQILRMVLYLAAIVALVWIPLTSVKCTVDDEEGTLTTPENRKWPIKIADIDRITRVTNKKGKLRYLNIHEAGVRFVDVKLLPAQADALIEHLVRINPGITVQNRNYI
ncbi:MAG: hypothetical protein J5478_01955 [Bacteroidales bacterium]|nr:hypothetical protein [Bacteroidales bacterium]